MAQQPDRAVQLFSATQAASGRAGTRFPRLPISRDLFSSARKALRRSDFDRAWHTGQLLTLAQIVELDTN